MLNALLPSFVALSAVPALLFARIGPSQSIGECWAFEGKTFPIQVRITGQPVVSQRAVTSLRFVLGVPLRPDTSMYRVVPVGLEGIGTPTETESFVKVRTPSTFRLHWRGGETEEIIDLRHDGSALIGSWTDFSAGAPERKVLRGVPIACPG